MTKEERGALLVNRIAVLSNRKKNIKTPGVLNKLRRKLAKGCY